MTPKRILIVTLSLTLIGLAVVLAVSEFGNAGQSNAGEQAGTDAGTQDAGADSTERGAREPRSRLGKFGKVSDFALRNHFDEPVTLARYKGKVWVAHFMFTRCAGICPQMIENLRNIIAPMLDGRPDIAVAAITCDPEHDTVEVLQEYSLQMGIGERGWNFLTGDKKVIEKLSVECFKTPIKVATGEAKAEHAIIHSKRLVLIDRQGEVRAYFDGTSEEKVQELLEAIEEVAAENPR